MARLNVMVFPCGSEIGLELRQALGSSLHVTLWGASSQEDHGRLAYERYVSVPNIAEPEFDEHFRTALLERDIDLLFATHDSVLEYLAPRMQSWGVHLVNGEPETACVTRRKSLTYDLFADEPWMPRRYHTLAEVGQWPVVIKPDRGQGGQGVGIAQTAAEAERLLAACVEPILCEYLPGREATVDCFSDWRHQLLHVAPRLRSRVRAGIAMRSEPLPCTDEIRRVAQVINQRLKLRGPWFFQLREDVQGNWKLLEVSSRLSSSSVALRAAGVNLALMTIQDHLQREQVTLQDSRVTLLERRLASVAVLDYAFDTAYVDLDDTLLLDGQANPQAMRFVYRLLQMGKRLVLVTRHATDPLLTLARARVAAGLFDEIVHLSQGEPKSSCIAGRAIFVDNHFPERLEVSRSKGIPVLDVDAMELFFP